PGRGRHGRPRTRADEPASCCSVAAVIDPDRVIDGLHELRVLSSDERGAQRVAWGPQWRRAREWLVQRLSDLPLSVDVDEAGNLWATLHGERAEALVLGSH